MKTSHKKQAKILTFGELIAAVYDECGKRRAPSVLRFAVNTHIVAFRARGSVLIS